MHDRAVVIWAVKIVCRLFPEVVYLFCQNRKNTFSVNLFKEKGRQCSEEIIHPNLAWCFSIQLWHSGLGLSGTAHAQSRGHAWTRGRPLRTTCTQDSAVTQSGFHQFAPETTSSLGRTIIKNKYIQFIWVITIQNGNVRSHAQESCSPISGLNIKEVGLMSARNKFNTCTRGNVLHPSFYGDSVHVVYH